MITIGLLSGLNLAIVGKIDDRNHYFHQGYSNSQSQSQFKLDFFSCCFISFDSVYSFHPVSFIASKQLIHFHFQKIYLFQFV